MSQSFQIAIDGPVAAGKGTVARALADHLNALYVDTGAMYRTAALLAKRESIDLSDGKAIANLISRVKFDMHSPHNTEIDGRLVTIIVDNEDISWVIRTEEISRAVPFVAALPQVRKELVKIQQQIACLQSVVMEGRDITTVVLPNASLKIYLTADIKERAKRRHQQLLEREDGTKFEKVLEDLALRDKQDMERAADPLQVSKDAWVLDTTGMSIDQVVRAIETKLAIILETCGTVQL
jgi:cytidylate kinase